MKFKDRCFWRGFFVHMFMACLIQDWYGLERYIEVCKAGWMNIHWLVWVPLLLGALVLEALDKGDVVREESGAWYRRYRVVIRRPQ